MSTPNHVRVGTVLLFLSCTLLVPSDTHAGDRRRVRAVSPPSSALAITFAGSEAGVMETGTIVWRGGAKRATVTTRTVRMRIGEASAESRGNVTIRAFLETPDPRCTIRIDGVPLTTAPRVIHRSAPIGVAFTHRIEIEVPVTAADGPLQASIGWEVTTE